MAARAAALGLLALLLTGCGAHHLAARAAGPNAGPGPATFVDLGTGDVWHCVNVAADPGAAIRQGALMAYAYAVAYADCKTELGLSLLDDGLFFPRPAPGVLRVSKRAARAERLPADPVTMAVTRIRNH